MLKQVHAGHEVILHVFRPSFLVDANAVFHGPTVHHEQRHDGVVVRRGGQFDLAVGGQLAVHRQNVAHVVVLGIQHVGKVGQAVIPVLHEQGDETFIAMAAVVRTQHVVGRELVEVPQDLQVEEILWGKQFIVHDGVGLEVVEGHVVEFLVAGA